MPADVFGGVPAGTSQIGLRPEHIRQGEGKEAEIQRVEHLGDQLRMAAPDLLAHGAGPEADRNRDFHDQATKAAELHMAEVPVHLIGHSFGATLALRLAIEAPARVRSLTLIEPVLFCAADVQSLLFAVFSCPLYLLC